jgi:hypothetical protein
LHPYHANAFRCTLRVGRLAGWPAIDARKGKPRRLFIFEWPLAEIDAVFLSEQSNIGVYPLGIQRYRPATVFATPQVIPAATNWTPTLSIRSKSREFAAAVVQAAARAQLDHPEPARQERARAILGHGPTARLSPGEVIEFEPARLS